MRVHARSTALPVLLLVAAALTIPIAAPPAASAAAGAEDVGLVDPDTGI